MSLLYVRFRAAAEPNLKVCVVLMPYEVKKKIYCCQQLGLCVAKPTKMLQILQPDQQHAMVAHNCCNANGLLSSCWSCRVSSRSCRRALFAQSTSAYSRSACPCTVLHACSSFHHLSRSALMRLSSSRCR